MSSRESFADCTAWLAHWGLQESPLWTMMKRGQHHEVHIQALRQALAQQEGAQGRSVEANQVRLQTATSMERNLRARRLQVGMVVCRQTHP